MPSTTGPREQEREPGSPKLGEALEFMRILWGLDHALQSRSKLMAATIGLTGPQRLVIRLVGRYPGIAAGALAGLMQIHPSTLTGILQRLAARQVLERRPDPEDGRRALLRLTERGRALDRDVEGTVEAAVKRALARLPERSTETARQVLDALTEDLARSAPPAGGQPRKRTKRRKRRSTGA